jgi:hypothetical protein
MSISMSGRTTRSLRAGRNNCLRPVHVAVTRLKFGLQLDRKPRKIDQVSSDEFPRAVWRTCSSFAWGVLKPDHEMHCVIPHFIGRLLRLEIKRPKTAVATSGSVKLRVQIEHVFGFQIDDAQIRITRTLELALGCGWEIAPQTRSRVEQLPQSVFEMAADFVDPMDVLNLAVRRVQALHRLIARGTDRFRDALIDRVVRRKRQHLSARRIEDQFTKRDAAQLLVLV